MELRVLRYFLAVAREGNITGAANSLHLSQPTLSRQIRDLEEELGHPLLIRKSHRVALTPEGVLFRKRAEEIIAMVDKTEAELCATSNIRSTLSRPLCARSSFASSSVSTRLASEGVGSIKRRMPSRCACCPMAVSDSSAQRHASSLRVP